MDFLLRLFFAFALDISLVLFPRVRTGLNPTQSFQIGDLLPQNQQLQPLMISFVSGFSERIPGITCKLVTEHLRICPLGVRVAQSAEPRTLDCGLGQDLGVMGLSPASAPHPVRSMLEIVSLSLSARPPCPSSALTLFLSLIWIHEWINVYMNE